jgi:hypothetical protein
MVITYGTLPNSSLALDFGFTLPLNPHDEVSIKFLFDFHRMSIAFIMKRQASNMKGLE